MAIKSYSIEFFKVSAFSVNNGKATISLGDPIQQGDQIPASDRMCAKITITGASAPGETQWYKVEGMASAFAKYPDSPTGQKELGPDAYLIDGNGNILDQFQHSNTDTPDLTTSSYLPVSGATDTYYFVVGPFNNFEGFSPDDMLSASMTVILYQKVENVGPTPTSTGGGE